MKADYVKAQADEEMRCGNYGAAADKCARTDRAQLVSAGATR